MRMLPALFVASALIIVSACTTTEITAKKALDDGVQESLEITQVAVEATPESEATPTILAALEKAVEVQLAARNISGEPARLELVVTFVNTLTGADRALAGALAGPNELNVTATIISQSDGEVLAEFDILGAHNPAALGAFSDQEVTTAESVAQSLVDEIYGAQN